MAKGKKLSIIEIIRRNREPIIVSFMTTLFSLVIVGYFLVPIIDNTRLTFVGYNIHAYPSAEEPVVVSLNQNKTYLISVQNDEKVSIPISVKCFSKDGRIILITCSQTSSITVNPTSGVDLEASLTGVSKDETSFCFAITNLRNNKLVDNKEFCIRASVR